MISFDLASDREGIGVDELNGECALFDAGEGAVEFVGGGGFFDVEFGDESVFGGCGWSGFGEVRCGIGFESAVCHVACGFLKFRCFYLV